jgi:hypothetical protein
LITLAVLFEASRALTMAALCVHAFVYLYFWLESMRISFYNSIHCYFALFIAIHIAAALTFAVRAATLAQSKAVAIKLETLRLFAIASCRARGGGTCFFSGKILMATLLLRLL